MVAKAHWGYSPEAMEGWRSQLAVTSEELRVRTSAVARVGGELAGFYTLARVNDAWELDNLWVLPRFMRRGIGRALVADALRAAREGGAREVVVDSDPNAGDFYLACGAVRRGAVPAPIAGEPDRVRPQLVFVLAQDRDDP